MDNVVGSAKKFGFISLIVYLVIVVTCHLGRVFTGTFLGGISWFLQLIVTCSLIGLLLFGYFTKKTAIEMTMATLLVAYTGVGIYLNSFSYLAQLRGYWAGVVHNVFCLIAFMAIGFVFVLYILKVLFGKVILSNFVPLILLAAVACLLIGAIFGLILNIVAGQPFYECIVPFANAFLYFGLFGYACDLFAAGGAKKQAASEEKTETASEEKTETSES